MFARMLLIALAIVGIGTIGAVTWDVTVMKHRWYFTDSGNVKCNMSVFATECSMLDDKDLWGKYKNLVAVKK